LERIGSESCIILADEDRDFDSAMIFWLKTRSIRIRHLKCSRITDKLATEIGSFGSCLQSLVVSVGNGVISDLSIVRLVEGCPNLHKLDAGFGQNITDMSIIGKAEGYPRPHLHTLKLSDCYNITDISIGRVAKGCPNLRSLNLMRCDKITDMSILNLPEGCPNLHTLDLSYCNITDLSMLKLAEGFPHLQNLDLFCCNDITDMGITRFLENHQNLHSLNIGDNTESVLISLILA
jgi:hypothetical protein